MSKLNTHASVPIKMTDGSIGMISTLCGLRAAKGWATFDPEAVKCKLCLKSRAWPHFLQETSKLNAE